MTATTATRTATRFVLATIPGLVKGETIRITTMTTPKAAGEELTGRFIGTASTGLRLKVDGKVVTRATSRIIKVEVEETHEVPADAPAAVVPAPADAPTALVADAEDSIAAAAEAEVAPAAAVEAPVAAAEDGEGDVYDADPIVDGKHLSAMTFAEVMVLAKKYKTPGRGVARIGALRDGVAKAIAAEAGHLAGASV